MRTDGDFALNGALLGGRDRGRGFELVLHAFELVVERALEFECLRTSEAHGEDAEAFLVHPVASYSALCSGADFDLFGPLRKIARC